MNKRIIENAILSAMNLISQEIDSIEYDDLRNQFEITLAELDLALKELKKD
jgi:hypothetical protein